MKTLLRWAVLFALIGIPTTSSISQLTPKAVALTVLWDPNPPEQEVTGYQLQWAPVGSEDYNITNVQATNVIIEVPVSQTTQFRILAARELGNGVLWSGPSPIFIWSGITPPTGGRIVEVTMKFQ